MPPRPFRLKSNTTFPPKAAPSCIQFPSHSPAPIRLPFPRASENDRTSRSFFQDPMNAPLDRVTVAEGSRGFQPTEQPVILSRRVATSEPRPKKSPARSDSGVAKRHKLRPSPYRGLKPTAILLGQRPGRSRNVHPLPPQNENYKLCSKGTHKVAFAGSLSE
jgi:hypothetical protein